MRSTRPARRVFVKTLTLLAAAGLGVIAHASDYYVDLNYSGANGAPFNGYAGAYNSVSAALASTGGVPAGASALSPNRIFFASGTYNVGAASLSYSRANVALIGLSGNPNDVVITSTLDSAYNPGGGTLGTTGSATLQLKGANQSAAAITFANSTDTPYIVNVAHVAVTPTGTYTGNSQTATSPAVALLLQGDEQAFTNCNFLGYQDTLYTKGGRAYFTNCTVSGDNDFIFANGTSVFRNCTINLDGDHSGGAITAASTDKRTSNGLVFLNSTLTTNSVKGNTAIDPNNAANASGAASNSMYLGRPWGWTQVGGDASTVFVNTKLAPAIKSVGWLHWDNTEDASPTKNNGNLAEDSRYAEYNSMDQSSNPVDVSSRVTWSHQLNASQAANYTESQLFSADTGGVYSWYGLGYPAGDQSNPGTGSANPADPNYSWPAYWGDRNAQNETNNDTVAGTVGSPPIPGNPSSYSNPSWTVAGSWDPNAQLATLPEPATTSLLMLSGALLLGKRRSKRRA